MNPRFKSGLMAAATVFLFGGLALTSLPVAAESVATTIYSSLGKAGGRNLRSPGIQGSASYLHDTEVNVSHGLKQDTKSMKEESVAQSQLQASSKVKKIRKKVYLLIFDPWVSTTNCSALQANQSQAHRIRLSECMGWNDSDELAQQYQDWFVSTTQNRVIYEIENRRLVNDIPVKKDGFKYDIESYFTCWNNRDTCHTPDNVDYNAIIKRYGICNKLNRGEIDEVWLFGGPYFGFWESTLAGPNAYWYNSPPIEGTNCQKLIPIMGFSYERGLSEMVHDLTHRMESTMAKVYGSWQEDRMEHNWDRFGLVAAQSPSFGFSGCGSSHWPPNATADYDYANPSVARSFCDDFFNYPNLSEPTTVLKDVSCSAWGCTGLGYYTWWFSHVPNKPGIGPDGKLNDWWQYLTDPNAVFRSNLIRREFKE